MDNFNFQTVTLAGRKILRDSIATGEDIIFTRFRIGDSAEQPGVPEMLDDVLSPRFWAPVAETRQAENGEAAVQVDGVFKQDDEHSDFYFRELGLFAKLGEGGQEVMFGYLHAGEVENYIPTSDSTNLATYNFIVTIPIGSASVLVTYDPEALVSLKKYKDLELRINEFVKNYDDKMEHFETDVNDEINRIRSGTEKKIKDFESDVDERLQAISKTLGNYVQKAGDTMTGKLTGTAADFSGDVTAKNVTGSTAIKGGTISGTTGTFTGAISSNSTITGTTITGSTAIKGGAISGTTGTFTGAISSSSTIKGTTITATSGFSGNLTGNVNGKINGVAVYTDYAELIAALGLSSKGVTNATLTDVSRAIRGCIYALCSVNYNYAINAIATTGLLEIKSTQITSEDNLYVVFNMYYQIADAEYRAFRYGITNPQTWRQIHPVA